MIRSVPSFAQITVKANSAAISLFNAAQTGLTTHLQI